jgi:hypothetical protein
MLRAKRATPRKRRAEPEADDLAGKLTVCVDPSAPPGNVVRPLAALLLALAERALASNSGPGAPVDNPGRPKS